MTIAEDRKDCLAQMTDAFKFIEQQAGGTSQLVEVGNQMDESRTDEIKVQDVMSSIRLLYKSIVKKDEAMK